MRSICSIVFAGIFTTSGLIFAARAAVAQEDGTSDVHRWEQEAKNVTILRDDWGIAHVYGKTDADAVFGMTYA